MYIGHPCDITTVRQNPSAWTLAGEEIDRCVAETTQRHCKLQFSLHLLVVVLVFNLSKCVAMLAMLWYHRKPTFVVWGDAMSSWLDSPDRNTEGRCLVSRAAVKARDALTANPQPIVHPGREARRALHSVSRRRWTLTLCVCALALIIVIGLFGRAYAWVLSSGDVTIISLGFGAVDSRTIVDLRMDTDGLVGPVLVANSPQVILSAVYLLYNGLFTGMQLVREYSNYEMQRKALRVTTPRGEQRSTYWLQLPYSYSIPLLVASAVLHWLISQSIFLVRVSYNLDEREMEDEFLVGRSSFTSIGISPSAILSVLVLGSCFLMVAVGLGFRKVSSHVPMAASCSFALAAAAHRPVTDSDAAIRPVQWGEVPEMGNDEVGHCCFTSHEVVEAKVGRKYAGVDERAL